jgi:hypothetical protein
MIETFRVGNIVSSREDGGGGEGEASLLEPKPPSLTFVVGQDNCHIPHLGSNICNRSRCDAGHPMDSSITRSGCFGDLFD